MTSHNSLLLTEIFPPQTGGSGRWFWEIYRRLPRGQFTIAAGEHAQQSAFDAANDLDVVRLSLAMPEWGIRSWTGLKGYRKNYVALRRLVRERQASIVHCGRCIPEGVTALALKFTRRIPYICFVHGEDIGTALCSREHAMLVRQVLKNARYCLANSDNTARLLREVWGLAPKRIIVIHPGADTEYFHPAPRDENQRRKLGWDGRNVILTVGRLQRRKGHDMLIRALPAVREVVGNVFYAIVGDGDERDELARLAVENEVSDCVQFIGDISDLDLLACYQQCDLFALPNREIDGDIEGFGMVLVEAQACGKPVVAGASGGTAETMRIGETGEIVPCDKPDQLASTLIALLQDPDRRERMSAAARRHAVEHFDWRIAAARAHEAFDRAARPELVPVA